MRSYCSLFIDVGYLVAASATRVTGSSLRAGIEIDHPGLIAALIDQAEAHSALPLLRVNWYDSGGRSGGLPDYRQERIGELPHVKLRLGRLSHYGEQKGVDLRIGLDLVANARNHAAEVIYLITGDDDLTEAVAAAQEHGVQVVVLAVPNHVDGPIGLSNHLKREADLVLTIEQATLDAHVKPSVAEIAEAAESETQEAAAPMIPSPAILANRPAPRPPVVAAVPEPPRSTTVWSSESEGIGLEPEEPVDVEVLQRVAAGVLTSWLKGASEEDRKRLLAERPSVPSEVDRALLTDASAATGVYTLDESVRFELRKQFWVVTERKLEAGAGRARVSE